MIIWYAPTPPQLSVPFTSAQMARLDRRFASPEHLPVDLELLANDCAGLLGAWITIQTGIEQWTGCPDDPPPPPPLDEVTWAQLLRLDPSPPPDPVDLLSWTAGLVYTFQRRHPGRPLLSRRLNLTSFIDRLEVEFLLGGIGSGVSVLRAHRLEPGGTLTACRIVL